MSILLAQITNPVLPETIGNAGTAGVTVGGTAVGGIIAGTMGVLFMASFAMAFSYLVFGGIQWITSGGDKASLEAARNKIIHALVGLVVIGSTWAIITLVAQFFGLDFTKLPIPTIYRGQQNSNFGSDSNYYLNRGGPR